MQVVPSHEGDGWLQKGLGLGVDIETPVWGRSPACVGQPASAAGEGQVQERTNVIPLSEYLKN